MDEFVKVGVKNDFPSNQTKGIQVNGQEVAIAHWNGKLTAFENRCSHAESLLTECEIEDGQVTCPLHGAQFDVMTGAAMTLPAVHPIKKHELKTEGEYVWLKLNNADTKN